MERTNILLVDDQTIILDGLEALLGQEDDLAVCGRALNGRIAVEMALALQPDVVLMDINMPEMDGIEATKRIKKQLPCTNVLVLSMYHNVEFVHELMDAGACGYLLKNTDRTELCSAIHLAASGQRFLAPPVQAALDVDLFLPDGSRDTQYVSLTRREKEIVQLICKELSTTEIAAKLFLSKETVETHRKNIASKLGIHCIAGLVRYAMERGWNEHD